MRLLDSLELELQVTEGNLSLVLGVELLCKSSKQSQRLSIASPMMINVIRHLG